MGKLLHFPSPYGASTSSLKPNSDESTVSWRDSAHPENTRNHSDGMAPAARQLLTAGGPTPSCLATAFAPPNASMIESTVFNMTQYSSDCLNVSSVQGWDMDYGAIKRLNNEMDTKAVIGDRISVWLEAVDKTAAELCRSLDLEPNAFSQWRNGVHRLPLEVADDLCRIYRLTLDWIYRGDLASLPDEELRRKINEITKRRRRFIAS